MFTQPEPIAQVNGPFEADVPGESAAPQTVTNSTLIVPLEEIWGVSRDPIWGSPPPIAYRPADGLSMRRPAPRDEVSTKRLVLTVAAAPGWVWFVGAMATLVFASLGSVVFAVAAAAYISMG